MCVQAFPMKRILGVDLGRLLCLVVLDVFRVLSFEVQGLGRAGFEVQSLGLGVLAFCIQVVAFSVFKVQRDEKRSVSGIPKHRNPELPRP